MRSPTSRSWPSRNTALPWATASPVARLSSMRSATSRVSPRVISTLPVASTRSASPPTCCMRSATMLIAPPGPLRDTEDCWAKAGQGPGEVGEGCRGGGPRVIGGGADDPLGQRHERGEDAGPVLVLRRADDEGDPAAREVRLERSRERPGAGGVVGPVHHNPRGPPGQPGAGGGAPP